VYCGIQNTALRHRNPSQVCKRLLPISLLNEGFGDQLWPHDHQKRRWGFTVSPRSRVTHSRRLWLNRKGWDIEKLNKVALTAGGPGIRVGAMQREATACAWVDRKSIKRTWGRKYEAMLFPLPFSDDLSGYAVYVLQNHVSFTITEEPLIIMKKRWPVRMES
jgi:hypothetical protein